MDRPQVVILGAGPAGLGAAFRLTRQGWAQATILEQSDRVGGIAGSFDLAGLSVDYGSHRLHRSCDPAVLRDIRALLGADLLDRPRHGRIRLRGRWIHFPLRPLDLALKLPPSFALGVGTDLLGRLRTRRERSALETFASVLERGLGRTICEDFYFPYARKLWGLEPQQLSATQAHRRVSANSLGKMARKILTAAAGAKPQGGGRFYYPRQGFGEICEAYARAARQAGAEIVLDARLTSVQAVGNGLHDVHYEKDGQAHTLRADHVWSTIPITELLRYIQPSLPPEYLRAAENVRYRAMMLIYLVLEQDRFSEYDAHYFPERDISISRLSEPKNYRNAQEPHGLTVLCAELPCDVQDPEWRQSDEELGQLVCSALARAGIGIQAPLRQIVTRRLEQAYPIYQQGYETSLEQMDRYLGAIEGLLTFGRQGLFVHDNIHHALQMAYGAADCLNAQGHFDRERWRAFRQTSEANVVED